MNEKKTYGCETCPIRIRAEKKPGSGLAWLWRWHTGWCPGWKGYQKSLTAMNLSR
jgi:hypothetical protein